MNQIFQFPCGNELRLIHDDDVAIPKEGNVFECIGMFFHYMQQQRGELYLNGTRIFALSMVQTCGSPAAPCDYVGLDLPVTKVARLENLLKQSNQIRRMMQTNMVALPLNCGRAYFWEQ